MYKITLFQLEEVFVPVATGHTITTVFQDGNYIVVSGDRRSNYPAGSLIRISSAGSNNGIYGVFKNELFGGNTRIYLRERLAASTTGTVHAGDTAIQKVAGTQKQYSTINPDTNTIDVINVGDIDETLEVEEGVYRIDSLSLTVDRIAPDFFNSYNDLAFTPFVCVIENEAQSTVLWHGVIDPSTIKYNAKTKYTAFEVLSWEFLIGRIDTPARSVFTGKFNMVPNVNGSNYLEIERFVNNYDMTQIIIPGDVLVADTKLREFRSVVVSIPSFTSTRVRLYTTEIPINNHVSSGTGAYGRRKNPVFGALNSWQVVIEDQVLHQAISSNQAESFFFTISDAGNSTSTLRNQKGGIKGSSKYFVLDPDGKTVILDFGYPSSIAWLDGRPLNYIFEMSNVFDPDAQVRILGSDIYGYEPTYSSIFSSALKQFEASKIIDAAYRLRQFGILYKIFTGVTGINASNEVYLSRGIELPNNAKEALKIILNTANWFYRLKCGLTVGGLPTLECAIIPRRSVNTSILAPVGGAHVSEWVEGSADTSPVAVIVKPNVEYLKVKGLQNSVGFWYELPDGRTVDQLTEYERVRRGMPQGEGVVEIEVAAFPSFSGDAFGGQGPVIYNDSKLKAIAKDFYTFYKLFKRSGEGKLAERRPDLIGNYVSLPELNIDSEGGRSAFVTKQAISLSRRETQFEGRIGQYVVPPTLPPVAMLNAPATVEVIAPASTVTVQFDATLSSDPQGRLLSFSWTHNGSPVGNNDPLLSRDLSVGTHTIQCTVSNGVNTSVATSVVVAVLNNNVIGDPENIDAFEVEKYRVTDGGVVFGEVRLFPSIDTALISSITYRRKTGGELLTSDVTTFVPDWITTNPSRPYYRLRVQLAEKHVSTIEVKAAFVNASERLPVSETFTFMQIPRAEFLTNSVAINASSQIAVTVRGDNDTRTTNGIEVRVATTLAGLDSASPTLLNNPATLVAVSSPIPTGEGRFVRITLITDETGLNGDSWTGYVSSAGISTTPTFDTITINNGGYFTGSGGQVFLYAPSTGYGSLVVGDLTLLGTGTTITGDTIAIADNIITLNANHPSGSAPTLNAGIEVSRGTEAAAQLLWDESTDKWGHRLVGGAVSPFVLESRTITLNVGTSLTRSSGNASQSLAGNVSWTVNAIQDIRTSASPTFANVNIPSAGYVGTASFTSGWLGGGTWRVGADTTVDSLTVRGTMKVYELLIQQIRATNGNLFVSDSAKIVGVSLAGSTYTLTIDADTYMPFQADDLILAQRFTGLGTHLSMMRVVTVSTTTFTATLVNDYVSSVAPTAGMDFVRIGNGTNANRRGGIYLSANDAGAPFIDIYNGVIDDYTWLQSDKVKARFGNLGGIVDATFGALSGYGLYADNAFLKGAIVSTSGNIGGWSISASAITRGTVGSTYIELNAATGFIRLGGTTSTTSSTAGVFMNTSGEINIVASSTNFIRRTGSTLNITSTTFTLTAGSGTNAIGVQTATTDTDAVFWAGGTRTAAPYRVDRLGRLAATSGQIGGWHLGATTLADAATDPKLIIDQAAGNIRFIHTYHATLPAIQLRRTVPTTAEGSWHGYQNTSISQNPGFELGTASGWSLSSGDGYYVGSTYVPGTSLDSGHIIARNWAKTGKVGTWYGEIQATGTIPYATAVIKIGGISGVNRPGRNYFFVRMGWDFGVYTNVRLAVFFNGNTTSSFPDVMGDPMSFTHGDLQQKELWFDLPVGRTVSHYAIVIYMGMYDLETVQFSVDHLEAGVYMPVMHISPNGIQFEVTGAVGTDNQPEFSVSRIVMPGFGTPLNRSDPMGTIKADTNYIYVKTTPTTWKRVALTAF
jgi:hypothetical protein